MVNLLKNGLRCLAYILKLNTPDALASQHANFTFEKALPEIATVMTVTEVLLMFSHNYFQTADFLCCKQKNREGH